MQRGSARTALLLTFLPALAVRSAFVGHGLVALRTPTLIALHQAAHPLRARPGRSLRGGSANLATMSQGEASGPTVNGKGYAPDQEGSQKLFSGPADRNTQPILEVLKTLMPPSGRVLSVAEGSGQHVTAFAKAFPSLTFQPTEIDEGALSSIPIYIRDEGVGNVLPAARLDCTAPDYSLVEKEGEKYRVVYVVNLTHIAPFEATTGLFGACKRLLEAGGLVCIYGPFKKDGKHTSEGNESFDARLRERDPMIGYRDIAEVQAAGEAAGFVQDKVVEMPANNFMIIMKKAA